MSRRARAVLAFVLLVAALVVGVASWSTPYVDGWTLLAVALAMAGLWVVAPLLDDATCEACRR